MSSLIDNLLLLTLLYRVEELAPGTKIWTGLAFLHIQRDPLALP